MTMESELGIKNGFTIRIVPWLVTAGALLFYAFTLNRWVSLANVAQVAKIADWTWQPELLSPVYFVATYPLRWLPTEWIPLGVNLFSALCAVLTLGQLARSVALLPHDRSHEEREREKSEFSLLTVRSGWFPPVLAAVVCGLQLTFWEHATNGTSEMLDLLLFAWVIRALLEYRMDGRESWLFRAALVCGVGMTNNFAMWGFLPLFIAALVWLRGLSFFNPRFLGRMALCGLIGLSLYLLLPLLASLSEIEPMNFWQALKANLGLQKNILFLYPKLPTRHLENLEWVVMVVVCILPVLLFSIRWPSYFGDTSQLGVRLATVVFHFMCALYLCVCIWCLFDAPFSPRYRGYTIPFLTFYYLAALSIGYFSGYFLLVFSNRPIRGRLPPPAMRTINRIVLTLVLALAVIAPVGLLFKNLAQIRLTNGPIIREYTEALAEGLPQSGVLLCDDPRRLFLMQAWLARAGREKDFLPLDAHLDNLTSGPLSWPAYHRYLSRKYPSRWDAMSDPKREQPLTTAELLGVVTKLAEKAELCYLHPSFGYYFEFFHPEPHGLAYHLKRFDSKSLLPPTLPPELIATNAKFWGKVVDHNLKPILAVTKPREPGFKLSLAERCFKAAHLPSEQNASALAVGAFYSRSLDEWAVQLQKSGDLERAGDYFELAHNLNADNVVAEINLQYNQNLRAGQTAPLQLPKSVEDRFGKYRTWDRVLGENGPYDEPGFCYAQAYAFMRGGFYRQAAQCFDRVRSLSQGDAASRMWLAQLNLMARLPDNALELAREIRLHPERFTLSSTNRNELTAIEARAHHARNEPEKAAHILEKALDQSPKDEHLLATVTGIYSQSGQYSNALATVNRHLKLVPNNPELLVAKGALCMQVSAFSEAIPCLNHALDLQPNNHTARFYRAICQLRTGQLDAAQNDYETIQPRFPAMYQIYYGLGEIAYRRKDTNAAIRYYESYLTNTVPVEESKSVRQRLKELKGEKP